MSIVKSLSVGEGDMFYIKHNSDNFTVIDCCLEEGKEDDIINEIKAESKNIGICRFISTHPDEDHIQGLEYINKEWPILNFYCVENKATKEGPSNSFKEYCNLRDSDKAFYLFKGCSRKWMNKSDEERGSSGLNVLWPITDNEDFKEQLKLVKEGKSPNNISPIIRYKAGDCKFLWMGDIETTFLEKVKDNIDFEEVDILFAPHHGRESGKVPNDILEKLNPKIIIVGEAPSKDLNYYSKYNTITQNSAGDIIFDVYEKRIDIYVGNSNYSVDFLEDKGKTKFDSYIGSLVI
ncbi:hypothetical protein [Intestinibacter sp.]|uniref:hypothetical protein n=1 Tax=Intestinibacter sp. TaxID=1965304 RepID=UPI003AB20789